MMEGENFAGFPHWNPEDCAALYPYARMLIEDLGFEGFRFDFVKAFGSWMIGSFAKYRYVKDGADFRPCVVGEYWSGSEDIDTWLDQVNAVTDNQIVAFDYLLRYKLKGVCDKPVTIYAT